MSTNQKDYILSDKGSTGKIALGAGVVLLLVSLAGYFSNSEQFFHSYLMAYMFWLTLALGGLFFTLVNHLMGSVWNVVFRRIGEAVMYSFPVLAVLFIPLLFGVHDLYHWTHQDVVDKDPVLLGKSGYLNITFFIIRAIIYFAIWFILSRKLYKLSLEQDKNPSEELILKMKRISAPGVVLYALSITFASFDWLMSLNPHWYSTIYGVYIFAGSFLCLLAFVVVFGVNMNKKGILKGTITVEHYHDVAKLIFAFLVFWGYMGFSQYFLIWYANIPEETIWYNMRWDYNWKYITMIIVFGHFLIPFLGLLPRAAKRNLSYLKGLAYWVLLMHVVDMYWLVFPSFATKGFTISWLDFSILIGLGGIFYWNFWNNFSANPLVPIGERRLQDSIKFKNI